MLNNVVRRAGITAALLAAVSAAHAETDISGNVALTSDYKFRGISQSDGSPAIQGGFDVSFAPGFYLGAWASSVDFDSNDGLDGSLEVDYYAGWSNTVGDSGIGLDVGYIYYDYPGDNGVEGDYQEVYLGASWHDLSLQVNYSDDYYAETGDFWYLSADYSVALADNVSLGLHAGYNMLDKNGGFLATAEDAFTDYSVALTYAWGGVDLSLAYTGTDLNDADVFGTNWGDARAIFTISKSL